MYIVIAIVTILLFYLFCYWVAVFVEGYFDENSRFKKWWRRNIMDWDPDEIEDRNDRRNSGIS